MLRTSILSTSLATLMALGLFYALVVSFGLAGGRNWSFGYYGEYNRIKHALTNIPGVMITKEWANEDVTLEEFGFELMMPTKQVITLNFGEMDPTRRLSGASLTRDLTEKLRTSKRLPKA